jgi:hypothetical protein
MIKALGAAVLAVSLAACAPGFSNIYSGADGKTLIVSKRDWSDFQAYRAKIGSTHRGAFAMGVYNGQSDGWASSYCEYDSCYGGNSENAAMKNCRQGGGECVLFARNGDILVNYKLADE